MEESKYKLIKNFINNNLQYSMDYKFNFQQLKKVCLIIEKTLENNKKYLDSKFIFYLISDCSILKNILSIIVENNKEIIRNNDYFKIFNSELEILLIEIYCIMTNFDYDFQINYILDNTTKYDPVNIYLKEINNYPILTNEEMKFLFIKAKFGDKIAKKKLIESNLRLVVFVAKKIDCDNSLFLDLIQEGNIGLIKAVENYDYEKGYKFSTFANIIIYRSIKKYINEKVNYVKMSQKLKNIYKDFWNVRNKLLIKLERNPSIEELALELNCSKEDINNIYKYFEANQQVYLNKNVDGLELIDIIPDYEVDIEKDYLKKDFLNLFYNFLKKILDERELYIIIYRYGLKGKKKKLIDLAKKFNVSDSRINEIEKLAIKKLIDNKNMLKEFTLENEKNKINQKNIGLISLTKLSKELNINLNDLKQTIISIYSNEDYNLFLLESPNNTQFKRMKIILKKVKTVIEEKIWQQNILLYKENPNIKSLYKWKEKQINDYQQNKLSTKKIQYLDSLGFIFDMDIINIINEIKTLYNKTNLNIKDYRFNNKIFIMNKKREIYEKIKLKLFILINNFSNYGISNLLINLNLNISIEEARNISKLMNNKIKKFLDMDLYFVFVLYTLNISISDISKYINISKEEVEKKRLLAFNIIFSNEEIINLLYKNNFKIKKYIK